MSLGYRFHQRSMWETFQWRMCSAAPKQAHHQEISWLWLRATGIGKRCTRLGRIPIRPVLPAEPDFFACCNVRRNQTIHGVPAELRKLRVRVKDEKRVARAGGDECNGCDADNSDGIVLHRPETQQDDGGYAGKQILNRKMNVVDDWKRNESPEKQEKICMIAPFESLEKQPSKRPQPKNRQEDDNKETPTERQRDKNYDNE